jgi:hypothetical protein
MPSTYIVVHDSPDGTAYPTDTEEEVAMAIEALRANGEESARVYAGEPDCPDSYANGQTLYVPPPIATCKVCNGRGFTGWVYGSETSCRACT